MNTEHEPNHAATNSIVAKILITLGCALFGTTVQAEMLLQLAVSAQEAERAAHRTISHQLSRKLRMIATFQIDVEPQSIVYKGFWIVRSKDTLIMVDSSSGCIHPLSSRAA